MAFNWILLKWSDKTNNTVKYTQTGIFECIFIRKYLFSILKIGIEVLNISILHKKRPTIWLAFMYINQFYSVYFTI